MIESPSRRDRRRRHRRPSPCIRPRPRTGRRGLLFAEPRRYVPAPPQDQPDRDGVRTNLLLRVVILWALILATVWVLQPYAVSLWAAATEPRTVTPRGGLAEYEEATIKLFKAASPSVVHVFAAAPERGIFQLEPTGERGAVRVGHRLGRGRARHHELSRDPRRRAHPGAAAGGQFDRGRIRRGAISSEPRRITISRCCASTARARHCIRSRSAVPAICRSGRPCLRSATRTGWSRP